MFEKIVLAVDGSDASRRAAEAAKSLAACSSGEVEILHLRERQVGKAGVYDSETSADAAELVDAYLHDLSEAGVKATAEVHTTVVGRAAQGILEEAKRFGADTIVMGSRGMSDWTALLLGSVAYKVIHHAECPVVVVR
jgi:nucleotide-binding universal stress UspA family protein